MNKVKTLIGTIALLSLMSCQQGNHSSQGMQSSVDSSIASENVESSSAMSSGNNSGMGSSSMSSIEEELMETNQVLDNLKQSPYSTNMAAKEDIGLSKASKVGIDKELFENEIKYAIPSDAKIYNVEDYNVTKDGNNNSGNLSILLNSIKSESGNKIIKFKSGTYPFGNKVDVEGISDLFIVGENDTLLEFSGWGTYFEARLSTNVHLYNIQFDMKYSPTISGVIKKVKEGDNPIVTLQVPEEFDLSNSIYSSWKANPGSYMECFYDETTKSYVPDRNKNLFYNSPSGGKGILSAEYSSDTRELNITLSKSFAYCSYRTPTIGDHVSFAYTMYENPGFRFLQCTDTYMEHINTYVTGGMGVRAEGGKNLYINHCNFKNKEGSSRIMTCTADIIHSMAVEGDVHVSNCLLEGSHDDALNIKSFYTKITSVTPSAREIEIAQTQNEINIKYEIGDRVDIFNPQNMSLVASYTIADLQKKGTGYILTVDSRPSKDIEGFNCGNVTKATHLKLTNCLIRNKRNRGILLQARESEISNCTFQNVVMGAVQVLSVMDSFREAIMPENIKICNNKFLNNYSDLSVFTYGTDGPNSAVANTLKNVEIYNNYFTDGIGEPVSILGGGNVSILNNLFHYTKNIVSNLISLKLSSDIFIKNNCLFAQNANDMSFYTENSVSGLTVEENSKKEL